MDFSFDLRFLFPPLLNLIIFVGFLKSQTANSWGLQYIMQKIILYSILKMPFPILILVVLLLLLFLFTPIRLPLNASRPIFLRSGGQISILLAILIVAAIILAPSLFLVTYLCLIMLSPWFATMWSLFKSFLIRFQSVLRSIPTIFISCVNRNQENIEADSFHQDDIECN